MSEHQAKAIRAGKTQINSLQVFRGFAALAVVAHHAALSTEAFVGTMPAAISAGFGYGALGVDFFFVLSGFIIMYAHFDDQRSESTVKQYIFKRLSRIYPAYLPIGVGLMLLYGVMPGMSASGGREYSVLSSLLLVPANGPPALSVAWTLVHELVFYAVFLLFFASRRYLVVGLLIWALVIVLSNAFLSPAGWLRYPLSVLNLEFMLGVGAAWLVRTRTPGGKSLWFVATGFFTAGMALWLSQPESVGIFRLMFALGLALWIVGFAMYEQANTINWPALLLLLGNASYSIYLVHNPLVSVSQRIAGKLGLTWTSAMVSGVCISVLVGWMYHTVVEKPALHFFRTRGGGS